MAKPDITAGCRVRLTRDVSTRGGTTFRAGLVMRVVHVVGEFDLAVYVRGRYHGLRLRKKDIHLLQLVSPPTVKE